MKLLLSMLILGFSSAAHAAVPAELQREAYGEWLNEIGSVTSPYFEQIFDWYEEQKGSELPAEVQTDPEHLVVSVERPMAQAIEAEANGDVEKAVTYGLETYGIIDADVDMVLETILFRWGKPIGQVSGETYPIDTVFGYRMEKLDPKYGPRAYATETTMKNGGVAKEQNDSSTLVIWGDKTNGYVIAGQFFAARGKTPSTSSMSIIMLKPMADGRTDYRVSGRYTGQSYSVFGIEFGRKNYGFNVSRIRNGQKDFYNNVNALKTTGSIPERRP